ncbi:fucolectin-5-like [Bufo bufo]|uniref:fucolectin-5-like n=1 Tax=Bufo bufo TaxID=8384 RepID=UPI001ABE7C82|nr:fucolectin-5-like [Bufo bufo]
MITVSKKLMECESQILVYPIYVMEKVERNVALNATVCQSLVYTGGNPKLAVDGVRRGFFSAGFCTHTGYNKPAWWRLDLKRPHKIGRIRLARTAARMPPLGDFTYSSYYHIQEGGWSCRLHVAFCGFVSLRCATVQDISKESYCYYSIEGRYVSIVMPSRSEYLLLCEAEVFGVPLVDDAHDGNKVNVP